RTRSTRTGSTSWTGRAATTATPTPATTGTTPASGEVWSMLEIVTINAFDRSYRINNPGEGRVASKLNNGEPYERKLLVDCYQQKPNGTVFDVGAHIGNHTLYFAAICGLKVHAWEPFDDSRKQLEDN